MATVTIDDSYVQHGAELEKTLDDLTETIRKILVNGIRNGNEKIIQYVKENSIKN